MIPGIDSHSWAAALHSCGEPACEATSLGGGRANGLVGGAVDDGEPMW